MYNCLDYVCIVHQVPQSHWHLEHGGPEHYSTHASFKNTVKPRLSSISQTPKEWLSGKEGIKEIHRDKIHSSGWKAMAWVGGQCSVEKEHQSKHSSVLVDGWGGTVDGRRFSLFMKGHSRRSPEYTRCLWRSSNTHWETVFFPALPLRQSSKETLHSSPWEACVKPVTAPLKTYCGCQDSFTSLPSKGFLLRTDNKPHSLPLRLLCTQVSYFSLKKWLTQQGQIFVSSVWSRFQCIFL